MNIITINTTQWAEDDFTVVTDMPIEVLHKTVSTYVLRHRELDLKYNNADIIEYVKNCFFPDQYFLKCVESDAQYISI